MNENYVYNFQQGTYIKYDDVGFRVITGGILEKFSIPPEYREELIICKNLKKEATGVTDVNEII
jgi:hypothetical protein